MLSKEEWVVRFFKFCPRENADLNNREWVDQFVDVCEFRTLHLNEM